MCHGSDVMKLNNYFMLTWKKYCAKKADVFCVVSDALRKKTEQLNYGIEPQIIPMGFDEKNFGTQYRIENYFGQNEKSVVLFVGRLVEIKGVCYLIEAMKNVDAILVIVGDGPLKTILEEQAQPIKNKVLFYGSKSHEELKTIYASADVFVMPSIVDSSGASEGLGLVALEAMASGIPVIASNTGGIVDIIQDEVNGILVEEKNVTALEKSIKRILEDFALKNKIVEKAFLTVENMTYKKRAEELYNIIKESK